MHNRILIIDDDAAFRGAQRRVLHNLELSPGRRVELLEAPSGTEGVALLQQTPVDCILLDHDMPGGNGLHWLEQILQTSPDQAVIMLTGHGSEQLAVDAMKNGALDYLVKGSFTPDILRHTIYNALEKIELRRTVESQKKELMDAERQRVMIESLGTACHHIGQPATVISAYLEMMQSRETDEEMKNMIASCREASKAINDILDRLLQISQYRSIPYLSSIGNHPENADRIIQIDVK